MKLGILQCDIVRSHLQPTFGDYPDMFRKLLSSVDATLEFQTFVACQNELPETPQACDAYLLTGSKRSVFEQVSWIAGLEDCVRTLHSHRMPLVGVCFGHQLIAQALGGEVERAAKGWGVGVSRQQVFAQPPWLQPVLREIAVLVSHQDQVTALPPTATLFAGNDFCPNAMFTVGDHIFTSQGHPEFLPSYARALMEIRRDRIPTSVLEAGLQSLITPLDHALVAQWIVQFLRCATSPPTAASK